MMKQRPDAPITIVPMSEIEISSYEGSIPPQLFVWALPPLHNSLENRKLIERDIQTGAVVPRRTDVRVVVCGVGIRGTPRIERIGWRSVGRVHDGSPTRRARRRCQTQLAIRRPVGHHSASMARRSGRDNGDFTRGDEDDGWRGIR